MRQFKLNLPEDVKEWVAAQATANVSSQNSEIIRAIRERMLRVCQNKPDKQTHLRDGQPLDTQSCGEPVPENLQQVN